MAIKPKYITNELTKLNRKERKLVSIIFSVIDVINSRFSR